jgi:sialidase-1
MSRTALRRICGLTVWTLAAVAAIRALPAGAFAQFAAPEPRYIEVYTAAEKGYRTFRIPSIIATGRGTLLAFAEARRDGPGDAGDIDLVLKRSQDSGLSWSPLQVVGDNGPNTFGNPCPVVDAATGTIWLLTTQNRGTDREKDIIAGASQAGPSTSLKAGRSVWVMHSTDDGVTWSAPADITASVKRADWTWYATGPGVGIQTGSGRLVIPGNHAVAGTAVHHSHVVFSDDGGRHWQIGGSADAGTNESQVVELTGGRLLLNMRNHPPKAHNFRMIATSDDAGRTWSPAKPDAALIEPPAQASLLRLTTTGAGGRNRLLFSNPASTRRERMTVRMSEDEGATWPVSRIVHEGPAAYSSLVVLPDRSIGLLFERGDRSPYEKITFVRFPIEWLTGGKDK